MIFYLGGYTSMLLAGLMGWRWKLKTWQWLALGLTVPGLLSVLRGSVGTDTASYLTMVRAIVLSDARDIPRTLEPGFELLARGLTFFIADPRFSVAAMSLLVVVACLLAFSRKRTDAIVFVALIFPCFFYDMSMNGLRYGIAFCLGKMAADAWDEKRGVSAGVLALIATSIHVSSIVLIALLQVRRLKPGQHFMPLILAGCALVVVFYEKLLLKLSYYSGAVAPDSVSGLAPLALCTLLAVGIGIAAGRVPRSIWLLLCCEVLSFVLARFSYAGLRFQWLVLFALCCDLAFISAHVNERRRALQCVFVCVGMVGFLLRARNMLQEYGQGPSPFLPYHFAWGVTG